MGIFEYYQCKKKYSPLNTLFKFTSFGTKSSAWQCENDKPAVLIRLSSSASLVKNTNKYTLWLFVAKVFKWEKPHSPQKKLKEKSKK